MSRLSAAIYRAPDGFWITFSIDNKIYRRHHATTIAIACGAIADFLANRSIE